MCPQSAFLAQNLGAHQLKHAIHHEACSHTPKVLRDMIAERLSQQHSGMPLSMSIWLVRVAPRDCDDEAVLKDRAWSGGGGTCL